MQNPTESDAHAVETELRSLLGVEVAMARRHAEPEELEAAAAAPTATGSTAADHGAAAVQLPPYPVRASGLPRLRPLVLLPPPPPIQSAPTTKPGAQT